MSVTTEKQLDVDAGAKVLRDYLEGINFLEGFTTPYTSWEANSLAVLNAINALPPGSNAGAIQSAASAALRASVDATGNGARVTDGEVAAGAAMMVAAIEKRRNP